eukprot:6772701-Pyramimonas_sp.AAC.1
MRLEPSAGSSPGTRARPRAGLELEVKRETSGARGAGDSELALALVKHVDDLQVAGRTGHVDWQAKGLLRRLHQLRSTPALQCRWNTDAPPGRLRRRPAGSRNTMLPSAKSRFRGPRTSRFIRRAMQLHSAVLATQKIKARIAFPCDR